MEFKLSADGGGGGTSLQGYFTCGYADLVEKFGEPNGGTDGYKVSTEWEFESEDGKVTCTLYDWKCTEMYDDNELSVQQFRAQRSYDWHVGAKSERECREFTAWLRKQLGKGDSHGQWWELEKIGIDPKRIKFGRG